MTPFSEKQMQVLCWWGEKSPHRDKLAVICDGAVRSGKTTCMGISFFLWAMARFQNTSFAVCGKTIRSVRRNVVAELIPKLKSMGFSMRVRQAENEIILSYQGRENRFYLFGGRDESSAALIQGMTLGGVLFDEVALMPRSFTIFSHTLFSVRFPIISGVFEGIFLCRILFIVPRVAKSVAITAKK